MAPKKKTEAVKPAIPAATMLRVQDELEKHTQLLIALTEMEVAGLEDIQILDETAREAKARVDYFEAEKETINRPLLDATRAVQKFFAGPISKYTAIREICRKKVADFRALELRAQRAAQLAADNLAAENKPREAMAVLRAAPERVESIKGTSEIEYWAVASIDPTRMILTWMVPNTEKLNAHCAAHRTSESIPEVPGVTFERRVRLVQR